MATTSALSLRGQASRSDSVAIATALADTLVQIGASHKTLRFAVASADAFRDRYVRQPAEMTDHLVTALRHRLGSRLDVIFSGNRFRDPDKVPPSITEVWSVLGANVWADSAAVVVQTTMFFRKEKCTVGFTEAIYRFRRKVTEWRLVSITPDTYGDGICASDNHPDAVTGRSVSEVTELVGALASRGCHPEQPTEGVFPSLRSG